MWVELFAFAITAFVCLSVAALLVDAAEDDDHRAA